MKLNSTSTLVLPRALASRASDVSKRLKQRILQLKTSWAVLSRKCSSVDGPRSCPQMLHAQGQVVMNAIF